MSSVIPKVTEKNVSHGPLKKMDVEDVEIESAGAGDTFESKKTKIDSEDNNGSANGNLPDLVCFEKMSAVSISEESELSHNEEISDQTAVLGVNHVKDSLQVHNTDCESSNHEAADAIKESDNHDECLKLHEKDEWLDILGNGQLKKKVLLQGKINTRPAQGSVVTVKVTAKLDNGVCIQDGTETFILGEGDVIAALDLCVALMDEQEVIEVVTAPRFAYGTKGKEPDIPGDTSLTLTVHLLEVKPPVDILKLTAEERLQFGEKKRERGNELFGREDYSGAINSYSRAVKFLDPGHSGLQGDNSVLQNIVDSRIKCYNNMAASQLKVGATDAVIRSCEEVLKCQADNIKAIYRIGKAYSSRGDTEKAIFYLKKGIRLDPESKLLHKELAFLTQKQKKQSETEKTMYKRMMGNLADAAQKQKTDKQSNNLMKWSLIAGAMLVTAASVGLAYYRASH